MHTRDGKPRIGGGREERGKKFLISLRDSLRMILHQSTSPEAGNVGNFCRPAQLCLHFQTLDSFLSWSACLVQDTISLAESERGGRWGGESLFVLKINADSRDLPPGLAPRPSGLCMHKQASPSSSLLTSRSKSAKGERQKGGRSEQRKVSFSR